MATVTIPQTDDQNSGVPFFPSGAKAVTVGDTYTAPVTIYVGVAGDVTVVPLKGDATVTFKNVPAGACVPVRVTSVSAATATNMVAVF